MFIGAVCHPERIEHQRAQDFGEGLAGHVFEQLLHHRVAAARVPPLGAGNEVGPDRRRVGWGCPVEHLHRRGDVLAFGIPPEAMHRQPGAVGKEAAQGDFFVPCKRIFRHLPRREPGVDVFVEAQASFLYQAQRRRCGHRFADRGGLEQRLGRNRIVPTGFDNAVAARPFNLEVVDDHDAEARHLVARHSIRQGHGRRRLSLDGAHRDQTRFDGLDLLHYLGTGLFTACKGQRNQKQEGEEKVFPVQSRSF